MSLPSQVSSPLAPEHQGKTASSDPSPPAQTERIDKQRKGDITSVLAYYKWVEKGQPPGTALQDWLEAEAELEQVRSLAHLLIESNTNLQVSLGESRTREVLLRQAEERYRNIFDNAVEGIFQTTPEGRFLTANPALARMLGYESPEDLLASVSDIGQQLHVIPERRSEILRSLREGSNVLGFECQLYRKDGGVIWVSLTARVVRDQAGAPRHFEGTVQDVTERKRAEEAVRHSEALYHSLVDTLPICIFRKDQRGRFTFGNKAFCNWLKRPPEEILGKTDLDFYPRELALKYIHDDRRVLEGGEILEAIEEHEKPEEARIYVQVLKAPLFGPTGEVGGMQGIFWDISLRKRAENELARTAAEFRVARTIQQRLFPRSAPRVAGLDIGVATFGFDIGGASYPAEAIGGDYYDFIPLLDGSLGIAIGDVSGHGVGPALLMAEARALLRAFARTQSDVSTILGLVNRVLFPDIESDRFITLLLAKLDPRTRSFTYASAGHPKGYILDAAGTVKEALPSTSIPLGIEENAVFPASSEILLQPGDLVLLLTDGIAEARSPEDTPFGIQRSLDLVRHCRDASAAEIVEQLYRAVRAFSRNLPQFDDITATVIKVNGSVG